MLSSSHRCSCGIETCEIILCRPRCLQAACRALCSWHTVMELVWLRLLWFRLWERNGGCTELRCPKHTCGSSLKPDWSTPASWLLALYAMQSSETVVLGACDFFRRGFRRRCPATAHAVTTSSICQECQAAQCLRGLISVIQCRSQPSVRSLPRMILHWL